MIDQLSTVLISLMSGGGVTGVVSWLAYRKLNKRLKESEVQLAEVNVDKGKIEAQKENEERLLRQIDHQQETIDKYVERYDNQVAKHAECEDRYQEKINEKDKIIRDQRKEVVAALEREKQHIRHAAKLAKELEHYKLWRCYREHKSLNPCDGCDRRLPEQTIPIRYIPIDDVCDNCEVTDCTARVTESM